MTSELEEGKRCPKFKVAISDDKFAQLKDYKGRSLVIFFYPKDSTPGCTTEAKDFTELLPKFKRQKTDILGVSRDSLTSHTKFIDKQGLKIPLGSDEEGTMCEAFGVWKEKSLYGRKFMGIERSTFLINEKGVIERIWRKVRVKDHVEAVLEAAKSIKPKN